MSDEPHMFRFLPSLAHMSKVKYIETLLRTFKDRQHLKDFFSDGSKIVREKSNTFQILNMVNTLQATLADLPLPPNIINDLQFFLAPMFHRAVDWLRQTIEDPTIGYKKSLWPHKVSHFVDNITFDNFGCVNGREMMRSYVRDLETVDFWTWEQLCFYCIEDDIMRFSRSFDWDRFAGFINSPYPIYWYHRIYGILPEEDMFEGAFLIKFEELNSQRKFRPHRIVCTVFNLMADERRKSRALAGLAYVQGLQGLHADVDFIRDQHADVILHFLMSGRMRQVKRFLECRGHTMWALKCVIEWPWILFIDQWIALLDTVEADFFDDLFKNERIPIRELSEHGIVNQGLAIIAGKIVAVFLRRFSSDDRVLESVMWNIFCCENILLSKLVFDHVDGGRRRFLIEGLRGRKLFRTWFNVFAEKFCEEVLEEDERPLFREVLDRVG